MTEEPEIPPQAPRDPSLEPVWSALRRVDDPEVGMNIVEVGLVYGVERIDDRIVVTMTMTSAACPMGEEIVEDVRAEIARACPDGPEVEIDLVWDPPWTPDRMSPQAREFFGWDES